MLNIEAKAKQAKKKNLNLPIRILKPLKALSSEESNFETDDTEAKATKSQLKSAYD